jgi:LPS sulfotransferase NodH
MGQRSDMQTQPGDDDTAGPTVRLLMRSIAQEAAMARPFLVLFTARSGSTALYGNLKSVPNVKMRAEVFGNKALPGNAEQNDDNRIKFLRKFWAEFKDGATPDDAEFAGFKLQINQKNSQFEQPARLVKVAAEYNPRIIVLRRQNMLKQVISSLNARRLKELSQKINDGKGSGHILPEDKALLDELKKKPILLKINEVKAMLNGVRKAYEKLDDLAEAFGTVHDITYEDYLEDRDAVVRGVLEYIGADPSSYQPADAYLKITSDSLAEVVENYDELRQALADTPFADMVA